MRKFLVFFLFSLLFLRLSLPSFADNNFNTSFDVTYNINEQGLANVIFKGTLQNTTDKYFASNYTLQSGFENIENISAEDSRGKISPIIKKNNSLTFITIPFNTHAYGANRSMNFFLSFDTTDIAKHEGSVWEINIPGINNQADFKNFTVHVRVPASFGKPAYIKPAQTGDSLDFDKETLGSSGISLAFGDVQSYDFSLNYHLKNDNLFPVTTEIALPPSTNYQEILINDLTPKPVNVKTDVNGNWLAQYYLYPSQKISINVKGTALVSLIPKKEQLSSQDKKLFTEDLTYWQKNEDIEKLAQDLKTPENIFNYVVHQLTYDFTRVAGKQERVGAENVLKNPSSAVCLEFTDLFIALSRAAGIPAREIEGFAYTQNKQQRPLSLVKDVLHAWPEYYDENQQTWVMVDPTWENTTKGTDYFHTLDFDHFAFVIHGDSSIYPIPPGGYKFSNSDSSKDVFVSFGKITHLNDPQATVAFDIAPSLFAGFPITGSLVFKNITSRMVPIETVDVSALSLLPGKQTLTSSAIPPFGYFSLPVEFHTKSFLTNSKDTITIRVAGNTITKTISVYPFFSQKSYIIIGGIILGLFSFGLFITASRTRRLPFFRRKR